MKQSKSYIVLSMERKGFDVFLNMCTKVEGKNELRMTFFPTPGTLFKTYKEAYAHKIKFERRMRKNNYNNLYLLIFSVKNN